MRRFLVFHNPISFCSISVSLPSFISFLLTLRISNILRFSSQPCTNLNKVSFPLYFILIWLSFISSLRLYLCFQRSPPSYPISFPSQFYFFHIPSYKFHFLLYNNSSSLILIQILISQPTSSHPYTIFFLILISFFFYLFILVLLLFVLLFAPSPAFYLFFSSLLAYHFSTQPFFFCCCCFDFISFFLFLPPPSSIFHTAVLSSPYQCLILITFTYTFIFLLSFLFVLVYLLTYILSFLCLTLLTRIALKSLFRFIITYNILYYRY